MKRTLLIPFMLILCYGLFAQPASPPSPPGHGLNGNSGGGSAPVGSGLVIFLALGSAYGARKIYKQLHHDTSEKEE